MISRSLPNRFRAARPTIKEHTAKKAADLDSLVSLIERAIPRFKQLEERQFYREVVQSYRAAARNIRRASRSDN